MISPTYKAVFACLCQIVEKIVVLMITSLSCFHKSKTNWEFSSFLASREQFPVYTSLVMRHVNTVHLITARHTNAISLHTITRFPTIGIGTNEKPVKSGKKHKSNA